MNPAVEALVAFAVATGLASLLYQLQSIAIIGNNLHALVAAIFLFLPQLFGRQRDDGLHAKPYLPNLSLAALGLALLPLYALLYIAFNRYACPMLQLGSLCTHLAPLHLRLPPHFLRLCAAQLLVVALPEEYFFRGYLQARLESAWPARRHLFGAPVGRALIVTALLFGVGHFLVTFQPVMLSRAIPGLVFGYMFARTRSILPGTIFHAGCNLLMEILAVSFPR